MIRFNDVLTIDDAAQVRFTDAGYMVAAPKVARIGIQLYYGRELGRTGDDANKIFRVLRPEDSVFNKESLASYAYKPLTDDHPPENVDASNWKKYSKGQMSGDVARDGEGVRVPMVLMDGTLIDKYKAGKKQLSVGYDCEITFQTGTDPKFGMFDAIQGPPHVNHVAVVDAGRAGPEYALGDGSGVAVNFDVYATALEAIAKGTINRDALADETATHLATDSKGAKAYPIMKDGAIYLQSLRACVTDSLTRKDGDAHAALSNILKRVPEATSTPTHDAGQYQETTVMTKIVQVDGIPVSVADDQSAAIIQKALDTSSTALKAAQSQVTDLTAKLTTADTALKTVEAKAVTDLAAKDAEIVTLKKAVEDSKVSPAMLDTMVKDRARVAGLGHAILGDKLVIDGKSVAEIMKQVVDAKLGELAKDWNADQIKISFDTITKDTKPAAPSAGSAALGDMSRAFAPTAQPGGGGAMSSEQLLAARDKRLQDAYKHPNGVAAA